MPNPATILPITIVFDHRPVDGAYCGRFLTRLKSLVEDNADSLFIAEKTIGKDGRGDPAGVSIGSDGAG